MDPIADLLTRIRNANTRLIDRVDIPMSRIKLDIVKVLKEEGFIANFKSLYPAGMKRGLIRVFLKYGSKKERVIQDLQRVSRPGLRIYRSYREIPKARGGFSVTLLSTSVGILTDRQAREKKVGGEVLCQVW